MSEGCQNSCPMGQTGDMNREDLVEVEETMECNVNAGSEIERSQDRRCNPA